MGLAVIGLCAHAAGSPEIDYARTCHDTPPVGMNKDDTFKACMASEKGARDALPPIWARAEAQARQDCLRMTQIGGEASYVELVTCLEMREQTRPGAATAQPPKRAGKPK